MTLISGWTWGAMIAIAVTVACSRPKGDVVDAPAAAVDEAKAPTLPPSAATGPLAKALVGLSCGAHKSAEGSAWEFLPERYRLRARGASGGGKWRLEGGDLVIIGLANPSHTKRGLRNPVERRWRDVKLERRGAGSVLVHAEGELPCVPIPVESLTGYSATVGTERPVPDAKTPVKSPQEAWRRQAQLARKGRTAAEEHLRKRLVGQWGCWGEWIQGDIPARYGQKVTFSLKLQLAGGEVTKATAVPESEVATCMINHLMTSNEGKAPRLDHEGATLAVPVELQGWK